MIFIDDIQPRVIYSIVELSYLSDMPYYTILYHIQSENLKAHKSKGSRTWRVKGIDFIKWVTEGIKNKI